MTQKRVDQINLLKDLRVKECACLRNRVLPEKDKTRYRKT
jgi:hypothetical protein